MTTIRKRISRPYLVIIILIPIMILVLFNIIVSFYIKSQAEEDLQNAVLEIAEQLEDNNALTESENRYFEAGFGLQNKWFDRNSNSSNIASIINNKSYTTSAELVVYDVNGNLSEIFNNDTFITDDLAGLVYGESEKTTQNEIGSVGFDGDTYYFIEVEYNGRNMSDKILYITKGLIIDEFVDTINMVLVIISVIITLVALIISSRVTNSIAKPIERLTTLVGNIKSDELATIDIESDNYEIKQLTHEINQLNKRIYHYDKSQKNFLHNASHELRTPLMSIQGYADGIEMGVFEDYKNTAHLISEQSKRLTTLVESLLKLARAENFSTNKKLEQLNISDSMIDLINGYNGYAISQNIEIKADITPKIFAKGNFELLQACAGNIISNAIRYANEKVCISLKTKDGKCVIKIQDDGKGVENLDKIFDRFSKGEDGNFGLGLSIAKISAEVMNGHIAVHNDNGAVFEITINQNM